MIEIENLSKSYNLSKTSKSQVLFDVNLKINNGDMVALLGPSGSGKSTLLHILSGLITFDSGQVFVDGMNLRTESANKLAEMRNSKMAIILQNFVLIDEFSVYDNVQLPLCFSKKKKQREPEIEAVLESVGILDCKNKPVYQLSGGQKQRVAIARGLINHPSYLLADEPTGSLDSIAADNVMSILKKINQNGTTIILVTHNLEIAKQCSRKILIKDGRICETTSEFV